jgi:hypothetical protein
MLVCREESYIHVYPYNREATNLENNPYMQESCTEREYLKDSKEE